MMQINPITGIVCLGYSRVKGLCVTRLHNDLKMTPVLHQDAWKCKVCGFTISAMSVMKGQGENEYWRTTEDLGSTGTNQSAGLTGITTGTYASSGTALNTIVNAGLISYKNLVWQGTSTIKWTEFPEPEPLPVEKATEPIRAWRCASRVEVIDGLVVFTGLTGPKYAAEDRAVCHAARGGEHHWTQIPVQSCTCGFYGMKPGVFLRDELKGMYPVWLEVEFYGRVLEATLGYRAQHQRVLNVYMSDYDWKELPGFRVEYTGTALKKCKQQAKDRK